jgi:hypothetical protein
LADAAVGSTVAHGRCSTKAPWNPDYQLRDRPVDRIVVRVQDDFVCERHERREQLGIDSIVDCDHDLGRDRPQQPELERDAPARPTRDAAD